LNSKYLNRIPYFVKSEMPYNSSRSKRAWLLWSPVSERLTRHCFSSGEILTEIVQVRGLGFLAFWFLVLPWVILTTILYWRCVLLICALL